MSVPKASVVREHVVQFYGRNGNGLIERAARFLLEGARRGEEVLVIAAPDHCDALKDAFAAGGGQKDLTLLDAQQALEAFMVGGFPDERRFEEAIGSVARGLLDKSNGAGVVAYGEMVGLLWQEHRFPAAIRLEQLWNRFIHGLDLRLLCGYPIDLLDESINVSLINAVLCAHDALITQDIAQRIEIGIALSPRATLRRTDLAAFERENETQFGSVSGESANRDLMREGPN